MTTASMIERLAWNLSEIAPEFLSEFSRWRECLFCFKFQFGGRKIGEPVDIRDFHFPWGRIVRVRQIRRQPAEIDSGAKAGDLPVGCGGIRLLPCCGPREWRCQTFGKALYLFV
jgi:hypothetical protein